MIGIKNLNKYFYKGKSNENHVLRDITLDFAETGMVCILGESGSGKTTLLNTIGGLDTYGSGSITVDGEEYDRHRLKKSEKIRNQKFGYIFQNYYLLEDQTVFYNVNLALNMSDMNDEAREERVDYVLEILGMKRYKKKLVSQLSGGQQQRVSIARALVKSPQVILADEPTGNLDEENTILTMNILKQISRECLVILVSHEKEIARFYADRIIEVKDGRIIKDSVNKSKGSYQRIDDMNIYLGDMEQQQTELGEFSLHLFHEKEEESPEGQLGGAGSIRLNLAWKDGKLFIQSPENISLALAGEDMGIEVIDGKRKRMEQKETEEIHYQLDPLKTIRVSKLPFRELWKLALGNIRMLGKRQAFIIGILVAASVMIVLSLADYMTQRTVDKESVVWEDSHCITVNLEETNSLNSSKMKKLVKDFVDKWIINNDKIEYLLRTTGVLTFHYEGFAQMQVVGGSLDNYSVVPLEHLDQKDLIAGRMPENRNEIVVDQWIVKRFAKSDSVLSSIYKNEKAFLGTKMGTATVTGADLTVVGVSDTGEPSVYVKDGSLPLVFDFNGINVMTVEELQEMYPGKYDDLKLEGNQVMAVEGFADDTVYYVGESEYESLEESYARVFLEMSELTDYQVKVLKVLKEKLPANYIISQELCDILREDSIVNSRSFKVYGDDSGAISAYLQKAGEDYKDYFKVKLTNNYEQQMKEYEKSRDVDINAKMLVTIGIMLLTVVIIYFTIKSNAVARSGELTVYRLMGISKGSILKAYILEMMMMTAYICIPAVLITTGIMKFIASVPSLEIWLVFPWWLAGLVILALFAVNALISILPVRKILAKPPAQLAAE